MSKCLPPWLPISLTESLSFHLGCRGEDKVITESDSRFQFTWHKRKDDPSRRHTLGLDKWVPRLAAHSLHYDHHRIINMLSTEVDGEKYSGVTGKKGHLLNISACMFILTGFSMGGFVFFLPYTWAKMENDLILGYNKIDSCISFKIEAIILTSQSRLWCIFIYCLFKILHAGGHFHPTSSQT